MNTASFLLQAGRPDHTAIITEEKQYTYAQLREAVDTMACCLRQHGVRPQQRVLLIANNSIFWIASYLATMKIGAVVVPLPTGTDSAEIRETAAFVNAHTLCIQQRYWRRMQTELSAFTAITEIALEQPTPHHVPSTWPVGDHFEAALMLTSGTTNRPKAVRLSHRNFQANTNSIVEYLNLSANDRIMVVLPFYYCFGTSLLHSHLRAGATLVISNRFAFPETVLDLMEHTQCTGFAGVPSTYHTLLRNTTLAQRNLPHLTKIQQAGGHLPNILIDELQQMLPHADIFIMYGQTEATARLSYLPPHLLNSKRGSIGTGIPNVTLQVVDAEGKVAASGATGEIIATGDNIALGYLNNPIANAERFRAGQLRTGDLGVADEDGYITIVGRKDDFVKPYGRRIGCQKIEALLMTMPDLVNVAVIGVSDLIQGEAIRAYVVLRQGSQLTECEIIAHCRQRMPRQMVPRDVVLIEQLPLNANGKVVKAKLRQQAQQEHALFEELFARQQLERCAE